MKDRITGVAFSADGQLIAASNDDSDKTRTAIWSAASGEVKVILDGFLQGFHRSASAVFLELPRRKYVASAEDGETIVKMPGNLHAVTGEFWSWTSTGKISRWIPGGKREQRKLEDVPAVRSFGLSSDGLHFATCHRDDRIRIWRWDEDACLGDAAIEHGILASVIHIALSAGALDVWVACGDVVRAWNRETKTWSIEIPNPGRNMGKVWLSPCGATSRRGSGSRCA